MALRVLGYAAALAACVFALSHAYELRARATSGIGITGRWRYRIVQAIHG